MERSSARRENCTEFRPKFLCYYRPRKLSLPVHANAISAGHYHANAGASRAGLGNILCSAREGITHSGALAAHRDSFTKPTVTVGSIKVITTPGIFFDSAGANERCDAAAETVITACLTGVTRRRKNCNPTLSRARAHCHRDARRNYTNYLKYTVTVYYIRT